MKMHFTQTFYHAKGPNAFFCNLFSQKTVFAQTPLLEDCCYVVVDSGWLLLFCGGLCMVAAFDGCLHPTLNYAPKKERKSKEPNGRQGRRLEGSDGVVSTTLTIWRKMFWQNCCAFCSACRPTKIGCGQIGTCRRLFVVSFLKRIFVVGHFPDVCKALRPFSFFLCMGIKSRFCGFSNNRYIASSSFITFVCSSSKCRLEVLVSNNHGLASRKHQGAVIKLEEQPEKKGNHLEERRCCRPNCKDSRNPNFCVGCFE